MTEGFIGATGVYVSGGGKSMIEGKQRKLELIRDSQFGGDIPKALSEMGVANANSLSAFLS
jgi:hypothetical protein